MDEALPDSAVRAESAFTPVTKVAEPSPPDEGSWLPLRPWIVAVLAVGVLARCVRYIAGWPLWGDETSLVANLLERDFAGLLEPLGFNQIAPIGFLFTVKSLIATFGASELTLRLVGFAASLTTLWLVWLIGRRLLEPRLAWLPACLVAVTHLQIRYAAEVKQYAVESLVTAALLLLALNTFEGRWRSAIGLVLVIPIALLCSMPAAFVGGAIAVAALPHVWNQRSTAWWAWFTTYGGALLGTFGAMYVLLFSRQFAAQGAEMNEAWADAFPDPTSPIGLIGWVLEAATGVVFAIPVGGEHGASVVSAALFGIGLYSMWRSGHRDFVRLVLATIGIALVAATLRKYPFGGHGRFAQYLLPLQCVPMAVGIGDVVSWIVRMDLRSRSPWNVTRRGAMQAVLIGLLVVGLGNVLKDVAKPYHGRSAREKGDFARWFWKDFRRVGDLVCVNDAWVEEFDAVGKSRHYDCFRDFYASDLIVSKDAIPAEITGRTGLVVTTTLPGEDGERIERWERALSRRFRVVGRERFPVNMDVPFPRAEEYHVVWVEPLDTSPTDVVVQGIEPTSVRN